MTEPKKPINPIRRAWRMFRSAITGRFVSRAYAKEHPAETVSERPKRKP
ncbi:hypothetical protein ACFOON_15125 [Novosphingobium piscinae]|uniref:Uncharacterized protein n=1 Tax=Novosphingobium piscinae TaxID=1507448 RepID=A0A7X1FYK2_9SPHN|nr:hypothetical protein [Novosphingobium piscinae]MBC2668767.1 hypothetical protein [Novosphingobium piscinae]